MEGIVDGPFQYHELIKGTYSTSALVARYDKLELNPHHIPLWRSYFAFERDVVGYLKDHKRILKSYPGKVALNELVIDLDTKDGISPEQVLAEARQLVQYLIRFHEVPGDYIRVFFSGSKGYHIHLPNLFGFRPSETLPETVKSTLQAEFGTYESLDTSMVRKNGLIRVPYSRHQETGLYKQPLSLEFFFSASDEEIRAHARLCTFQPWNLPDEIETSLRHLQAAPVVQPRGVYTDSTDTTTRVTCMQKLWNRGAEQGRGHKDSLRLASWLRRMGIPKEAALHMLRGWYGFDDDHDQIKVVNSVYSKKYTYSCNDEVMREFCDSKCIFHKSGWMQEDHEVMIRGPQDLMKGLKKYAKKIQEEGGVDLQEIWPTLPNSYILYPGECAMFTGDTGLGKSSLVQNLCIRQWPIVGKSVLYLNLEMNEELAARRFLQVAHGYTKTEAYGALERISEEQLLGPVKHIDMISIPPKINQVFEAVKATKPDILVIDTTDAIEVPEAGNNENFQLKAIVEMMRKIATMHQPIVIAVHHITKEASKKGWIDLNSLTGNRANVTKMDHVFAVEGKRHKAERTLRSLKTRDDEGFKLPLLFDGARMQMTVADSGAPLFNE